MNGKGNSIPFISLPAEERKSGKRKRMGGGKYKKQNALLEPVNQHSAY